MIELGLHTVPFERPCNTEGVFRLRRPEDSEIAKLVAAARESPVTAAGLLSLEGGRTGAAPGFAHDASCSQIGRGERDFATGRQVLRRWRQFDLGWVFAARAGAPLELAPGENVAIVARTAALWSVNISRILEIVDKPHRFGFLYATTPMHVESGQERFLIEMDAESGAVTYRIEAMSRPRSALVWAAYPLGRAMQHRFARESHARMRRAVAERPL